MSAPYAVEVPLGSTYDGLRRARLGWTALAWTIAAVVWAFAVAAVATVVASGTEPAELANWVMDVVTAVVYGAVVTLMLPRTRHPVVWLLALTAVGCAASGFATAAALLDHTLPGNGVLFYLPYWAWVPGVYATCTVVPLLAVPAQSVRRPWLLIAVSALVIVLATLPGLTAVVPGLPANPFGIHSATWQRVRSDLGMHPHRVIAVLGAVVLVWLVLRRRSAPEAQRRGLLWLIAGQAAMVIAIAAFVVPTPAGWASVAAEVSGTLLLVAQLFLPAALLVLVLGQQLWGMRTRVDRSLVWAAMTVSIALATLVLLAFVARGLPVDSDVAVALVVGVIGLGAVRLRAWIQRHVDHLVYGTGADPARLLRGVGEAEFDLDALAEALCRSLRLSAVHLLPPGPRSVRTEDGEVDIALVSRGRQVGRLVALPRPGERLDRRTTQMLSEVAGMVAMTIDLSQSVEALTAARSRVASVRHEERRALRRDLHDGLGPALAGIRLGLIAARGQQEKDPVNAAELFDTVERELSRQGEEVRRLSRSLVPLALEDGDLASALTALAARFETPGCRIDVTVSAGTEQAAGVQVALYQLVSEALLNMQRHAHATRCSVVVRRRADGDLVIAVSDDGIGIAADAVDGVGLRSMRERALELGATLRIGARPGGGTEVELRLPTP
ncbi:ATP-binding protein [Nocardioides sp.]|uniref:sensor histidine kinase n=1 Tax=Nocardioides sp. TaxID=35761 RepID=UPI00262DA5D0|nr:ATP-binding protein [Nocardioides sp.]